MSTQHPAREFAFDIGPVRVAPATALAPMEGITDKGFRALIRGMGGCGLTVTEFVSSDLMSRNVASAWRLAELPEDEHPVSIQIYGRDPEKMAQAAEYCEQLGADVVDLNLGCPSKAVTSGCSGSALMKEPELARRMFAAVKAAVSIPMTVKMRLGWDTDRLNAPEIAWMAQEEGADMVVVHGRTRMQMYRGSADWAAVRATKARLRIPVLVNGDILTVDDAVAALAASGADGVMVGRGAMRDPWILRKIADHFAGRVPYEPPLMDRRDTLLKYFGMLEAEAQTDRRAVGRMKKVTGYFTRGLPYGTELRETIYHSFTPEAIRDAVHGYFERLQAEGVADGFTRIHEAEVTDHTSGDSRNLTREAECCVQ
ncbi:MAG: tRNA dihydrouridine synthase DusB [Myxococcales bacterium]|nr:tRNA dihydrouridine synthase DusB [Myxococcales bacterium]